MFNFDKVISVIYNIYNFVNENSYPFNIKLFNFKIKKINNIKKKK